MAQQTNQRGYEIVSADYERISVKTVTTSKHVILNLDTGDVVGDMNWLIDVIAPDAKTRTTTTTETAGHFKQVVKRRSAPAPDHQSSGGQGDVYEDGRIALGRSSLGQACRLSGLADIGSAVCVKEGP